MDSRAYAALTPGLETPDELDACTLLVNSQVTLPHIAIGSISFDTFATFLVLCIVS